MHLAESSLKRLTLYREETLDSLYSVLVNGDVNFFKFFFSNTHPLVKFILAQKQMN